MSQRFNMAFRAHRPGYFESWGRTVRRLGVRVIAVAVTVGMGAAATSSARAATVDFNFQSPSGDVGSTQHTYTVSGVSITATGLTGSFFGGSTFFQSGSVDLFDKTAGGDENGLGLTNDSSGDHEITHGSFVEIQTPSGLTSVSFNMDSSTGDDSWQVWGCANATTKCSLLLTGTNENTHSLALDPYYFFTAGSGNVLLANLDVTTTPVPAALPLFGSGLGVLFAIVRRKRRNATASA